MSCKCGIDFPRDTSKLIIKFSYHLFDSTILISGIEQSTFMKMIHDNLKIKRLRTELIFRGSEYNFDHKKFHQICDDQPSYMNFFLL